MEYTDDLTLTPSRGGVLVLGGNNTSIRVDNGLLKILSDGAEASYSRATCPLRAIVVTRDQGYISFSAIHWLHDKGVSLCHLDYTGTPLLTTAPRTIDLPKLRRMQALAATTPIGPAVTQGLLKAKVAGQSSVLSAMGQSGAAQTLAEAAAQMSATPEVARMLVIESTTATIYWRAWQSVQLRFARSTAVPDHWQRFGVRQSALSKNAYRAMSPGGSLLNYLYGLSAVEMTIALSAVGLDPGIGIFHVDRENRDSLTFDALEAIRPSVDLWLWHWLETTVFSKRDFYELQDGGFRITRPLTSHLALTKPIWRPLTEAVATWIAKVFETGRVDDNATTSLAKHFSGFSSREHFPKQSCLECGRMLPGRQRLFCSHECDSIHRKATGARTPGQTAFRLAGARAAQSPEAQKRRQSTLRKRASLRTAWETAYFNRGGNREQLAIGKAWFFEMIVPRLAHISPSRLAAVLSATFSYGSRVRNAVRNGATEQVCIHPRHYLTLAGLVGVQPPPKILQLLDFAAIPTDEEASAVGSRKP